MAAQIEHVVVLMLENRSFDCMLGKLHPKGPRFEGLSGDETNPWHKDDGTVELIRVWNNPGMDPATARIPDPDPGELFLQDMNIQLFGLGGVPNNAPPPMSGFVDNYVRQVGTNPPPDAKAVMHYFTDKQVPVISTLARAFGVSDQWHASAPCQTWPNRFFAHTGTAGGYVNNEPTHFPYVMPTIFHRLRQNGRTWIIYFHDVPQSATLSDLWAYPTHFRFIDDFEADARNGRLPHYSFIEPRYFTEQLLRRIPNDQHPPHNVVYGEQLMARVYNAVRSAPSWQRTLLIITYDEHGGCYDHMPPPRAVPPSTAPGPDGFAFDRYGVRVPAVIVSPYIAPQSVIRSAPSGLPDHGPPYPFDHTSIIATLRKIFNLGAPLTARDGIAPDLTPFLTDAPDNLGPAHIDAPDVQPSPAEVARAAMAPPNHLQKSLCGLGARLPEASAQIGAHIAALRSGQAAVEEREHANVEAGQAYLAEKLRRFLGRE